MSWLKFILDKPTIPEGVEPQEQQSTTGVYYDTEWSNGKAAKVVRLFSVWGFMKPAIGLYGSPKVIGADRLDEIDGPVVFASNHHSHADTTLLLATIPAHLRRDLAIAAGADYFFGNRITSLLSTLFLGAIPIERTRLSKLSIENTESALKAGRSLLIFPEGGRSNDGWNGEHQPGAAFVAKRMGVPIVPIYIDGTGTVLPKGSNWPTRAKCAVVFGEPITIADSENPRSIAKVVERRVAELANEFSVGWWEAKKQSYRDQTPSAKGPEAGAWRRRWALGPKPSEKRHSPSQRRWPKV